MALTNEAVFQTILFTAVLVLALAITARKIKTPLEFLSKNQSTELKGMAILFVIFSHIGYFLVSDHRFLFPLSTLAGVGVDTFLILSGFGLTVSMLSKSLGIIEFYKKRLLKIFIPMWLVISVLFILDFLVLRKSYDAISIISHYLGYFPRADVYQSLNSPLWYFTFILFYYLVFPLVFMKNRPWLSVILVISTSLVLLKAVRLPLTGDVVSLYVLHVLAFPIGMALASSKDKLKFILEKVSNLWYLRLFLILTFSCLFWYLAIHSGVGKGVRLEETISLATVFLLLIVFVIKKLESGLLILIGEYSYEIYLFHWPLMYRYDFLYNRLPLFIATGTYLVIFLLLAVFIRKITKYIPAHI